MVLDVGLFLAVLKHDHERILVLFVLLGHVTIAGHVEAIQLIKELFKLGMLHSIVHWDYLDPTLLQELDMSTWDIYISIYLGHEWGHTELVFKAFPSSPNDDEINIVP